MTAEGAWPEGGVPPDIIDAIYDAALDEDAFARLPAVLARSIGARSGALLAFDATG